MTITNRKLLFGSGSLVAVSLGFLACGFMPALIPVFTQFCATVTGIFATYSVGNVAAKAVTKEGV